MGDLQRAFCYISRKRLKSFLLLLVFLVVNSMALGILGIQRASEEVMRELKNNAESRVILEIRQGAEQFTEDEAQQFLTIPGVSRINCLWSERMSIPELAPVVGEEQSEQLFTVHIQNRIDRDSPFEEKIYRLLDGNFPSSDHEVVINQLLAERNGLGVGDVIGGKYRIAGVFLSGTERQQTDHVATENRIENQIYLMADENLPDQGYVKVVCYAEEPEKLEKLADVLDEKCNGRAYVQANNHTYQKMRISIEQTGRITLFVLAITLLTGCSVTGLLLSMWMRGRKTEIAVYVSLGLEKSNLLFQFAAEGLMLYLLSFVISAIMAHHLLPMFLNHLEIGKDIGGSLEADYTGSFLAFGCGMGMILLLTVIAMLPYLKKQPKEILSEMEG